jgi:hypothetical protein
MTVYSKFYNKDTRSYFGVTVKNNDCIDHGIVRAKQFLCNKYNLTSSDMITAHYDVR